MLVREASRAYLSACLRRPHSVSCGVHVAEHSRATPSTPAKTDGAVKQRTASCRKALCHKIATAVVCHVPLPVLRYILWLYLNVRTSFRHTFCGIPTPLQLPTATTLPTSLGEKSGPTTVNKTQRSRKPPYWEIVPSVAPPK